MTSWRSSSWRRVSGGVVLLVGVGVMSFAVGRGVAPTGSVAATTEYLETTSCGGCSTPLTLTGVEAQSRSGSNLFLVRGTWPASLDQLPGGLRLVANDLEVVLNKPAAGAALTVATARRAGTNVDPAAIAVGLRGDRLLLNIADSVLAAPVNFEIGVWDGTSYLARLPATGQLRWDGHGPPQPVTATAPNSSVSSSSRSASSSPAAEDLTGLAGSCTAIPTGIVPQFLTVTAVRGLPPAPDPRTHTAARQVQADVAASPLGSTTPYTFVAVVEPPNTTGPTGQSRAFDQAGTTQLVVVSDGVTKRKAVRTFNAGRWTARIDTASDDLTFVVKAGSITLFWTGLQSGDRIGIITAADTGCAATALDSNLTPQQVVP